MGTGSQIGYLRDMIRCQPFLQIISSELKYGLHFATVATRWDPLCGGALEVQKKVGIAKFLEGKKRYKYVNKKANPRLS